MWLRLGASMLLIKVLGALTAIIAIGHVEKVAADDFPSLLTQNASIGLCCCPEESAQI